MKKVIQLFALLFMLISINKVSIAQTPTYQLGAINPNIFSINYIDDALTFDIYMFHTNAPTEFEYSGGQYFLSFNRACLTGVWPPGGPPSDPDTSEFSFSIIESDLPPNLQPRNPSVYPASNPTADIMRLAVNIFPGSGSGYIMTGNPFPGTKIAKVKLWNKISSFTNEIYNLNHQWRNPPIVSYATKVFAYVNSINIDITTPNTHYIEPVFWPVELSAFNASINRNSVKLDWLTTQETNNSGFDIERKQINSDEWRKVTHVTGSGTTNESKNYSFSERLNTGKYNYRLKQIDFNGSYQYFNLSNEVDVGIPAAYDLSQNYPNPFNPSTKIDFDLPHDGIVRINLYDISGREVYTLVNETKTAGYYTVQFNADNISSGIYFYRISSKDFLMTKRMMLVK